MICDNSSTHKHAKVQPWLQRHPRFHMHFTPTSSSWLNRVEGFFLDLTQNRLRRGVFRDVEELIMAIGSYIDHHNLARVFGATRTGDANVSPIGSPQ